MDELDPTVQKEEIGDLEGSLVVVQPLELSLMDVLSTISDPEAVDNQDFINCCLKILAILDDERALQGRKIMGNDEKIVLIHEMYRTYLEHKDHYRKDGSKYFNSHLCGAVEIIVKLGGIVGLATILATFKHDNLEDLVREDVIKAARDRSGLKFDASNAKSGEDLTMSRNRHIKSAEVKAQRDEEKRLLAELIDATDYLKKLSGENKEEKIELLAATVQTIARGVTKFRRAKREDTEEATFKRLLLVALEAIRTIYVKLADRAHNMLTIAAQDPEAQTRIMKESEVQYLPLARILRIRKMVEFYVDRCCQFFNPKLHQDFGDLVEERRSKLSGEKRCQIMQFFGDESIDGDFYGVSSLKFIGLDLSHYVGSIEQDFASITLADLPIGSFDPMEEILVTIDLKDPKRRLLALNEIAAAVEQRFATVDKSQFERDIAPIGDVDNILGMKLICYNPEFGRLRFRINDSISEAKSKRGVLAESATYETPRDIEIMIKTLFDRVGAFHGKKGVKYRASAELLKPRISVRTPDGDTVSLPQGSTALDFAAALHEELLIGLQGVMTLPKLTSVGPSKQVDQFDELRDGAVYILDINDDKTKSLVRPEWLLFANSVAAEAIRRHLQSKSDENPEMGRDYLDRLAAIFNVRISEFMTILAEKYNRRSRERILDHVGAGIINPVLELANCVKSETEHSRSAIRESETYRYLIEEGIEEKDMGPLLRLSKWEVWIDIPEEAGSLRAFSEEFSDGVGIKIDQIRTHIPGRDGESGRLKFIFNPDDSSLDLYDFFIKLIKLSLKYRVKISAPLFKRFELTRRVSEPVEKN